MTVARRMLVVGLIVVVCVHVADPGSNRDHRHKEDRDNATGEDGWHSTQTHTS